MEEIKRRRTDVFIDRLYCCGDEMISIEMQMTYPPKYVHRCKKCSSSSARNERYPCIRYLEYGDSRVIESGQEILKDKYKL
jgi:hypothetical protein